MTVIVKITDTNFREDLEGSGGLWSGRCWLGSEDAGECGKNCSTHLATKFNSGVAWWWRAVIREELRVCAGVRTVSDRRLTQNLKIVEQTSEMSGCERST